MEFTLTNELLLGAVAGPFCVGVLTPQRNAMSLTAKDVSSTYFGLYRKVFSEGLVKSFRGGLRPAVAAVPVFTAIGPVYLATEQYTGNPLAGVLMAGYAETVFSFSAVRTNTIVQYNATRAPAERIPQASAHFSGPGFGAHVMRNVLAISGIRMLAPHCRQVTEVLPVAEHIGDEGMRIADDLVASSATAVVSMPFSHVCSWAMCTPELQPLSYVARTQASARFLYDTYRLQGLRLFRRDLAARISYVSVLFTGYHFIERRVLA